jgi:hypothetical protein
MAEHLTGVRRAFQRHSSLKLERASWVPHWMELGTYLLPRNGRFYQTDRDRGIKKHNAIYDNTGTRAMRVLAAGLMSGMTSPARPWFRLAVPDAELNKYQPVKIWLDQVRDKMLHIFASSNTYLTLHSIYEDLGCFGTAASIFMDDYDTVINHYHSPVGEFCLGSDFRGNVNAVSREFQKTVGELVGEFGYQNCSGTVQRLYDSHHLDQWVSVVHLIELRKERDLTKSDGRNKRWSSCYFELGRDNDQYLREGGMDRFRVLAPRWQKMSGDIYGMSPAMEALGDVKQLQHEQLRKANAIDYQTKPPLQVPTAMKNRVVDQMPGGITYVDATGPSAAIRSAFDVNLNLSHLLADIQDVHARINSAFYADLFLMLSQSPADGRMTATEVAERHEEKLLILGPVLERLHNELLSPLIELTFERMSQAGILPPPPPELEGVELDVEFISTLAQAQRAIATNGLDRFLIGLGGVAQMKPDVLDKFDADKWADVYSDALGVDPALILAGDKVALVRQQRAEAEAQAQASALAQQQADAAAKLGTVSTQGGASNAATDILNLFSGYGSPSGVEV